MSAYPPPAHHQPQRPYLQSPPGMPPQGPYPGQTYPQQQQQQLPQKTLQPQASQGPAFQSRPAAMPPARPNAGFPVGPNRPVQQGGLVATPVSATQVLPRPPPNGTPQQQQQQQQPGGRPLSGQLNPGARPPGSRPMPPPHLNQQQRTASPIPGQQQAGMATAAPHPYPPQQQQQQQQQQQHANAQPAPISGYPQSPPRPALQNQQQRNSFHQAQAHSPQQQVQPQHQHQHPPVTQLLEQPTRGSNGLQHQMSNLSLGSSGSMNQQVSSPPSQPPPGSAGHGQGPPPQTEAKSKAGAARSKRVYASDPSTTPQSAMHQAPPGYPPMAQQPLSGPMPPGPYGPDQSQQQQPQQQQGVAPAGYGQPPHPQQQQQQYQNQQQHQNQQRPQQQQQQQFPHQQQPHHHQQQQQQQQGYRPPAPAQPKAKLDPDNIPSPVTVQEQDQKDWDDRPFVTLSKTSITPLASTDFSVLEGGNCNPRFFRMTTYNIPDTEDLLNISQIPVGLVIQPLAQLRADEPPIETVDYGDAGPPRCNRCKAYMNPYMTFVDGGQRFECNLCQFENDVEPSYFCNLDMNGRRCDLDQRPELRNGTIEYAVPQEYWSKTTPPQPVAYVFAIDVSWNAVQSGMLSHAVRGVRSAVWDEHGNSKLVPGARIGILTYDRNVHFYNLSSGLDQAQMMVVPDVSDIFVPLREGFLVDPQTSFSIATSLLEMLPQLYAENKTTETALGAAVQAVRMALEGRGGKLLLFQTILPNCGPGTLHQREDTKLYGTDKEKQLFGPQDDFYKKLAESCVDTGMSIDLFLFPNAYVDVATVGCLSSITGGETIMFQPFVSARDGAKFEGDVGRLLSRPFGFNALMRVRCSTGLRIAEHIGNFYSRVHTDLELGGIDSERAFGVLVKHDGGRLDERVEVSFQVALLYTRADGRRRVRVHNFRTPVTSTLGNVFRWADMDTTINFLTKGAISQALSKPLNEVRDALTEKCVKVLSAYRRNCASTTAAGQLILPESFKLFPLYTLAMLKSKILRPSRDINSDLRVYHMRKLKSMGVAESVAYFYPRMMAVHALNEQVGIRDAASGKTRLPPLVRMSYQRLQPGGAYLLENSQNMYLWLGTEISTQFLQDVFGISRVTDVNMALRRLPELETTANQQLRSLLDYLQSQRSRCLTTDLTVIRQGMDQTEFDFSNLLIEDTNNEAMSYVDYLPTIHRMIQNEVTTRPHEVHTSIWSR